MLNYSALMSSVCSDYRAGSVLIGGHGLDHRTHLLDRKKPRKMLTVVIELRQAVPAGSGASAGCSEKLWKCHTLGLQITVSITGRKEIEA